MFNSLSILIPAYNIEETIELVVVHAQKMGKSIAKKLEIVVVDDGSTDTTPQILKTLQKKIPELRIVTHQQNQGYGMSIKDLYYAGTMEWLLTLPGDDQIEPDEAKKLVPYADRYGMILGKRKKRGDHLFRIIQSKTYNALLKVLFNIPTTDVNTIRLMKQEIMKNVTLTMTSPFVDAELVLKTNRLHYPILEVEIEHKPRKTAGATGGKFFKTILPTFIDVLSFFFTSVFHVGR